MHFYSVGAFGSDGSFVCLVKEGDGFDDIEAGEDGSSLFQIYAMDAYRAAVFISLELKCTAADLQRLQRLGAFTPRNYSSSRTSEDSNSKGARASIATILNQRRRRSAGRTAKNGIR